MKWSKSLSLGSKVILVAETCPVPSPHAQRMISPGWLDAGVVYSALFSCLASNSKAAVFTAGISLEQLLVPASIIMLTSQGAAKNDAELGR